MKKYVCLICGYTHEGDAAPDKCPICNAPASKFQEQAGEKTWAAEHVIGVAKGARIVTDKYVDMRLKAQKMIENHETDKPLAALIDPEYKDQKAVKIAIAKLCNGRFQMVHPED